MPLVPASAPVLTVAILAALLAGCALDAQDIERWAVVADGDQRLAGYLADPERPIDLRQRAAIVLLRMDQPQQIVGVLANATADDRQRLMPYVAASVVTALREVGDDDAAGRAANLGFYLLRYADDLTGPADKDRSRDQQLVETLIDWCLAGYDDPEASDAHRRCTSILLAAGSVRPQWTAPRLLDDMRQATELDRLVLINGILARLKDPAAHRQQGRALLEFARRRYPQLEPPLADAMVHNRNPTLLRYLLDAARDRRVPQETREIAQEAARDHLGKKGLPGFFRLLRTDEADNGFAVRFNALDLIWLFGGVGQLEAALQAMPADLHWPTTGDGFKAEIDAFCDEQVARSAVTARPVLEQLLGNANWVARAYAAECVLRLYPDAAAQLLRGLTEDQTPLPGFSAEGGPTSLGAYVKAALAEG